MTVDTSALIDALAKDKHGHCFSNYGYLQLRTNTPPSKNRLDYARREYFIVHIVQHSWLMFRAAFLDTAFTEFVLHVHQAQIAFNTKQLFAKPTTGKKYQRNKQRTAKPVKNEKAKKEQREEENEPFWRRHKLGQLLSEDALKEHSRFLLKSYPAASFIGCWFNADLFGRSRHENKLFSLYFFTTNVVAPTTTDHGRKYQFQKAPSDTVTQVARHIGNDTKRLKRQRSQ